MSRVLVAYASKHGATREIAEAIANELQAGGHDADCLEAGKVAAVESYDAVVLGSAVYMKRWRRSARRLLAREHDALAGRPLWIFSSGPCGSDPDPSWSEPPRVVDEVERLGARDHVVFGGRLPVEPSSFMERAMVKNTPPEERDRRDFVQIRSWAAGIAGDLAASGAVRASASA